VILPLSGGEGWRGLLDYDDLDRPHACVASARTARAWVHYKLDQGVDHVLIDEAQDTARSNGKSSGG